MITHYQLFDENYFIHNTFRISYQCNWYICIMLHKLLRRVNFVIPIWQKTATGHPQLKICPRKSSPYLDITIYHKWYSFNLGGFYNMNINNLFQSFSDLTFKFEVTVSGQTIEIWLIIPIDTCFVNNRSRAHICRMLHGTSETHKNRQGLPRKRQSHQTTNVIERDKAE